MNDLWYFLLFVVTSVFALSLFGGVATFVANSYSDGRAADRCEAYGETSGIEVRAEKTYCFINDPEYGWITYQERMQQRFAERGMKYE